MAEALAALGAAAAASTFVEQALAITTFFYQTFSKIKDAPEDVQNNLSQIEQLISLSKLVIANPSLQTDVVASILGDVLRDATRLEKSLHKLSPGRFEGRFEKLEKLKKASNAFLKEDATEKVFKRLDRHKVSLAMAMHEIDSSLLHSIGVQLTAAQTRDGEMLLVINDMNQDVQTRLNAMADDISTVHVNGTELSDKLTSLHEHLSTVLSFVKENQEVLKASVSGCSHNAQRIFDVPTRRAGQFVGREDIITRLTQGLAADSHIANCAVLRGLGGQGKSRIALEYALRTRNSPYSTTLWVDSTSKYTLQRAFELFYRKFRIKSDEMLNDLDSIVAFVRESFESMPEPWLIVFDNYDDPSSIDIQDYMPLSKVGSIVVTTRHADVMALASPGLAIELGALQDADAIKLLLDSATINQDSSDIEITANKITTQLASHALAIVQAGAYLRKSKTPIGDFLAYYNTHREAILSRGVPITEYNRKNEQDPTALDVFATWELSMSQLRVETGAKQAKEDLLTTIGFFEGLDMSEEIFKVFCDNIEPWDSNEDMKKSPGAFLGSCLKCWDADIFSQLLAEFHDLALIQGYDRAEDGFYHVSVHPLVKEWIRLRQGRESSMEYRILVTEMLIECANPSQTQQAPSSTGIINEFTGDDDFIEEEEEISTKPERYLTIELLKVKESLAQLLDSSGHFQQAERLQRQVLRATERFYGSDHLETIRAKFFLGRILSENGKYRQAEDILGPIYGQSCRLAGMNGEYSRKIRMRLGMCKKFLNQAADGQSLMENQLQLDKMEYGADSFIVIEDVLYLAHTYRGQDKSFWEPASKALLRYSETHEVSREDSMLDLLSLVGQLYVEVDDFQRAKDILTRVWQGFRQLYGDGSTNTLAPLSRIMQIELRSGDLAQCEVELTKLENAFLQTLGPEHPYTLENALYLAHCLWRQGKHVEAEAQLRFAQDGTFKVYGKNDYYFTMQWLLSGILSVQGKLDEGEAAAREALAGRGALFGTSHPEYLKTEALLQRILDAKSKAQEKSTAEASLEACVGPEPNVQ